MAQFPKTDAELLALAQAVLRGFRAHPDVFPNPPVNLDAYDGKIGAYGDTSHELHTHQAQVTQLTAKREGLSDDISDATRTLLRYAEIIVTDDSQLGLVGWAGRAARTPLQAPGQARQLAITKQGADWLTLTWQSPSDGGKAGSYVVQYRDNPGGAWLNAGTTADTQLTLAAQPRGKPLEYRVYALNKAGNGLESNVVAVTL
jgi:hypothetical protein